MGLDYYTKVQYDIKPVQTDLLRSNTSLFQPPLFGRPVAPVLSQLRETPRPEVWYEPLKILKLLFSFKNVFFFLRSVVLL